ncbi:MAG: hypothetical protein ACHQDE_04895 [Acidimicrobiia bacterium]
MNFAKKAAISGALLGLTITGGALGASVVGTAGAQTDTSTATSAAAGTAATGTPPTGTPPTGTPPDPSQGGHTANGITEALLTGDTATKVTAAAQGAVPGATVDRVENDAEGATYEAHMTKSDGSRVTVKVNADFSVASTEDGMK